MNDIANPLRQGLLDDRTGDACAVVIFGASGDLTRRKLMPALYNLAVSHVLPGNFAVVGVARRNKSPEDFKAEMVDGVGKYSRRKVDPALGTISRGRSATSAAISTSRRRTTISRLT